MKLRLFASFVLLLSASGCGLLADAVSDASTTEFDVPMIEPTELGQTPLASVQQTVSIDETSPTWKLDDGVDTTLWGPVLKAHLLAVANGDDPIFEIVTDTFTMTASEPISFYVEVFSRDGEVWNDVEQAPVAVSACTFELNPATAVATDMGDNLTACVLAWVEANGVPQVLDYEVTAYATSAGRQTATYTVTHVQTMQTNNAVEGGCNQKGANEMPKALRDNLDIIVFEDMKFGGVGGSSENVYLASMAWMRDGNGKPHAYAEMFQYIAAGQAYWLYAETDSEVDLTSYSIAGTANVAFAPEMPEWIPETIRALGGFESEGRPGSGYVCWIVAGDAPRTGFIAAGIQGVGRFDASGN